MFCALLYQCSLLDHRPCARRVPKAGFDAQWIELFLRNVRLWGAVSRNDFCGVEHWPLSQTDGLVPREGLGVS